MEESKNRCYHLSEGNNNNPFLRQSVEANLSVNYPAGENILGASDFTLSLSICVCAGNWGKCVYYFTSSHFSCQLL